jgi:glycosyltransferase involved in cell wall biosynthesis
MRDFTLVIVNDSLEREPVEEILHRLGAATDPRVVAIHNDRSLGRSGAMNAGIDAADSEYFILHDDDDSWHPEFLAETCRYLDVHPEDAGVGTRTEIVYESIADGRVTELRRELFATNLSEVSLLQTLRQNYVPPIALLLRRRVFDDIGRFNNDLPVLADWEFNLRLLSRFTVGFIDGEPLAYWHHRESATGDEGNSVIAESNRHQAFNLMIRDTFIRTDIGAHNNLGSLLVTAEFFRQLDAKFDIHAESRAKHLEAVHANLAEQVNKVLMTVTALSDRVTALSDQLEAIKATTSDINRVTRRIRNPFRRKR